MKMLIKKFAKFSNLYHSYVHSYFGSCTSFVRMIPTDKCNLGCTYCWQKKDDSYEMTIEEFDRYLAHAKKMHVGIITFLGGEPMIWPPLYEAISHCTRASVLTDITTNGTLLNEETIDKFGRAGLDYLNISVDGTKPSSVTNKNSIFRKDILAHLKNTRKKYQTHFRINSVLYSNNLEDIKTLIEFSYEHNIQISLGYIVPPLEEKYIIDPDIYFSSDDTECLKEIVSYILARKKEGYPIIDPADYFENIFRYLNKEKFWECNYPTRYGWINISPNGRLRSCTKKMDELDYHYLDLTPARVMDYRNVLKEKVQSCNVHCYSNCAFDSYFYRTNKIEFFKKVWNRITLR